MHRAIFFLVVVGGCSNHVTSGPLVGSWSSTSAYLEPIPAGETVTVGVSFAGDGTNRWTVAEANVAHLAAGCQRVHRTNALSWYSDSAGASGHLTTYGTLAFTVEVSSCADPAYDHAAAAESEDPLYPIENGLPYTVTGSDLAFGYTGDGGAMSVHFTRQ